MIHIPFVFSVSSCFLSSFASISYASLPNCPYHYPSQLFLSLSNPLHSFITSEHPISINGLVFPLFLHLSHLLLLLLRYTELKTLPSLSPIFTCALFPVLRFTRVFSNYIFLLFSSTILLAIPFLPLTYRHARILSLLVVAIPSFLRILYTSSPSIAEHRTILSICTNVLYISYSESTYYFQ